MRITATKLRLVSKPPTAPLGLLGYDTLRWDCWDAAEPSRACRVFELNQHNAARAAGIELCIPQWRVRVRPALPERVVIHDEPLHSSGRA